MTTSTDNSAVLDWSLDQNLDLAWTEEDDTVVPGHHSATAFAFTWGEE